MRECEDWDIGLLGCAAGVAVRHTLANNGRDIVSSQHLRRWVGQCKCKETLGWMFERQLSAHVAVAAAIGVEWRLSKQCLHCLLS